jgi:hypothetical protein
MGTPTASRPFRVNVGPQVAILSEVLVFVALLQTDGGWVPPLLPDRFESIVRCFTLRHRI